MTASERRRLTYRYERLRAPASGILEAAGMTFLLLIAVRHFQSGALAKALIGAGTSVGLMFGPWLVSRVQAAQVPACRAAALVALVGAGLFGLAAALPFEMVFVVGTTAAMACAALTIPLMTQVYHENYPEHERGTLFSRTVMIRILATAGFSYLAGRMLSPDLARFQWLLLVFAGAFALASWCLYHCPSRPLTHAAGTHPFRSLRHARDDRLFRQTLISWMLLGFGNLMMVPLRVEYLANPEHGWTLNGRPLTAATIALLTGVVPNAARLLLNPLWGRLFDRVNFFVLRMALNAGFLLGILTFFLSGSLTGLVVGAVFYGISHAGGDVAWSLWVTKFAPPDRVADYMSVHAFFTGVRGVIAPVVAFQLVTLLPVSALALISGALIGAGTLVLIPEIRHGGGRRHAAALTEEVLD
ncbi:MAG: MFS transporter [Verrucomicrobia bacterium]|jgi:MFS family permease|nr:MFS transporter [Verrucomicrobiota bacterium]